MTAVKRLAVAALLVLLLAACGGDNFRDLEDIQSRDPDKVEVFNNVDQHPNLVLVCIHGVAFVTTTRDYKPFEREPDLDKSCPGGVAR
jgi:hypothetical protein